jgi:uncharacterized protein YndB with AHSA1/START domain
VAARAEIDIDDASPAAVFAVLVDPEAYIRWVVGARRLRGVDPHWPEPGARFHHEIGTWPFLIRDWTAMVELVPHSRIVLEARVGPVGTARVTILVEARAGGTHVTVLEEPVGGVLRTLPRPLLDPLVGLRNRLSLARLRELVAEQAAGVGRPGAGV